MENTEEKYMRAALGQAALAYEDDEVPVGAVIVCNGRIIARAYNMTERLKDPTAHAEMQAITMATEHLGGKYTPAEVVVKVAGELKRLSGQLPQTEALAKYTILEYYNNLFHAVDSSKGLKERLKYIKVLLNEFKKYGYVEDFKAFLGRRKVLLYFPTPYVVLMMCYLRMLILKLR